MATIQRALVTGIGPISTKVPRIDDRKLDPQRRNSFTSAILSRSLRKNPRIDHLIPLLDLKGISTNGFQDALISIPWDGAKELSATHIVRLKKGWEDDFYRWEHRTFSGKKEACIRADGIHFHIRPEEE